MTTPIPIDELLLSDKSRFGRRAGAGRPPSAHSGTQRAEGSYWKARPSTAPNTNKGIHEELETTQNKYSILRSTSSRFPRVSKPATDAVYYYDKTGPKKDVEAEIESSPVTYFQLRSSKERPKTAPLPAFDQVYNTNALHKADVSTAVEHSALSYTSMRSASQRFQRPKTSDTLGPGSHGVPDRPRTSSRESRFSHIPRFQTRMPVANDNIYDLENTSKKSVATAMEKSPQKYSIIRSKASRLGAAPGTEDRQLKNALNYVTGTYNVDTGPFKTLATEIETEGRSHPHIFHSTQEKVEDTAKHVDPALRKALLNLDFYDTDTGHKESIATHTSRSGHRISTMDSRTVRKDKFKPMTSPELGPGTYEYQKADTVLCPRAHSQSMARADRFDKKGDLKSLQRSTFDIDRENQEWRKKPAYISQTGRKYTQSGSGVDRMYNTDTGYKMTLQKSVEKSPIKYKAVSKESRSKRLVDPRVFLANDTRLINMDMKSENGGRTQESGDSKDREEQRQYSGRGSPVMKSRVPRFKENADPDSLTKIDFRATDYQSIQEELRESPRTYYRMKALPPSRTRKRH